MPDVALLFAGEARRGEGGRFEVAGHFDGKIARPRLARFDTPAAQLRGMVDSDDAVSFGRAIIAAWDFSHAVPTPEIRDLGSHALHGSTVNCPARAVTSHDWDGSCADWRHAPSHYAAIHFHSDDLYDCGWEDDFTVELPDDMRSGFHAIRVSAAACETFVPFFVSPRPGRARAPVAFVAATATYLAYANTHVKVDSLNSENLFESVMQICEQEAYLNEHRELGYSTYDVHADGSGVFYSSWQRPLLTMQPGLYTFNYVNDTHVIAWLEALGQPYEVITDHDLHRHGSTILRDYRVVITGSHPEYFTTPMWDALYAWQLQGGRHIYLGGNGFYWRTAIGASFPAAIEIRRGITGVRTWEGEPGEDHLGFTGEPGGLWRSAGRAPQKLCGVGFSATIFNRSTYYRRTPEGRDRAFDFVFAGVENSERIGNFGLRGGGAVGLEIDRWDPVLGSPPNGAVIATSEDVGIGGLLSVEEFITTTRALDAEQNGKVRADMCLFPTPNGGAVFSVGSIAWPTSLPHAGYGNDVARITTNVLRRFLDPAPIGSAGA
ncbi:MAG: N,N-dimethylformamidase [Alphaproteobacteria bacterium]|nr:N,N-dimethylformamidase [Alphaproteobacteria bacterium]